MTCPPLRRRTVLLVATLLPADYTHASDALKTARGCPEGGAPNGTTGNPGTPDDIGFAGSPSPNGSDARMRRPVRFQEKAMAEKILQKTVGRSCDTCDSSIQSPRMVSSSKMASRTGQFISNRRLPMLKNRNLMIVTGKYSQ